MRTGEELEGAYREWIEARPHVLALFERFALQMLDRGRRFGAKQLAERVRWEVRVSMDKDEQGYRLNNNYTAYIARDLIARHPDLSDLIETRRVRAEKEVAA